MIVENNVFNVPTIEIAELVEVLVPKGHECLECRATVNGRGEILYPPINPITHFSVLAAKRHIFVLSELVRVAQQMGAQS